MAARARNEINRENNDDDSHKTEVARGTPIFEAVNKQDEQLDPEKNGVLSVLATVKELQLQNLLPAA